VLDYLLRFAFFLAFFFVAFFFAFFLAFFFVAFFFVAFFLAFFFVAFFFVVFFFVAFFFVAFFLAFFLVAIKISLFNVKFRFSALTSFEYFILNVFNVKWIFIGKEAKEKNNFVDFFYLNV